MAENHSPDTLLEEALKIVDLQAREAYLDEACGDDEALRGEIESLLAAHFAAEGFMETAGAADWLPQTEQEGDWIGRYKLLELIGEGAFGRVWMAEQREPMQRQVALKIVKLGMDTGQVVARFEAERQALAIMEHPNIARVFDGGATENGRPYFVMELVCGVPITTYCDANKLTPRARIDLFGKVCEAVRHAHQKGIIHRDLKPSNILVTVQDDQPVPKVIDFGIAKALQKRLTERTLFTRHREWVGTPEYMSPEQAGLESHDVDTRSDVYSLGVILYELLTGRTPFGARELREKGYEAILRTIREEDPPKPSTRLSSLSGEELSAVANHRGESPDKLGREVKGELDWILLKALERDRTRRYESANHLAEELGRFSAHEPISAVPPSFTYRAKKHLRKHPGHVTALVGSVVLLMAATAVITWWVTRPEPEPFARTGRPLVETIWAHEGWVLDLAYSPAKNLLASCGGDKTIKLWCSRTGQPLATFEENSGSPRDLVFTPDGNRLISGGFEGRILVWDVESGKIARTLDGLPRSKGGIIGPSKLSVSRDGRLLAAHRENAIQIWSIEEASLVTSIDIRRDRQGGVAFGPDGKTIAFTSSWAPGSLTLWDLESGQEIWSRKADARCALDIAFSPDGTLLATGNADHSVRIWDVRTGQLHRPTSIQNSNWVGGVGFSTDGKTIASTSSDSIRLSDADSGKVRTTLKGHLGNSGVRSPVFLAEKDLMATGGEDGTIRIWDVEAAIQSVERRKLEKIAAAERALEAARAELSAELHQAETVAGRYVKLLIEKSRWTTHACIAELNVMDAKGGIIPQGELSAFGCSSFQDAAPGATPPVREARLPDNVIDGDPATFWHSRWYPGPGEPFPHWIVIDLGQSREISGFLLRNRPNERHVDTLKWRLSMSDDAENWKEVAAGGFESSEEWQGYVFGQTENVEVQR